MAGVPKFPATGGTTVTTTVTSTRTTTTSIHRTRPFFNLSYIRTFGGILKLVELLLDLIALICLLAGPFAGYSDVGWAEFVSISALIVTLILLFFYLFHVVEIFPSIPWLLLESVYCIIWVLFFAVASGLMTSRSTTYYNCEAYGAAAFFGFLAMAVYGFDGVMKCIGWRRGQLPQ